MPQQLQDILWTLLLSLLDVGITFVIYGIRVYAKRLREKAANELESKYIYMLEDTVTKCVLATQQTYVANLKKENMFDKEAQKQAFKMCFDNVIKMLSQDAYIYIENLTGDADNYITQLIEAEVLEQKK